MVTIFRRILVYTLQAAIGDAHYISFYLEPFGYVRPLQNQSLASFCLFSVPIEGISNWLKLLSICHKEHAGDFSSLLGERKNSKYTDDLGINAHPDGDSV